MINLPEVLARRIVRTDGGCWEFQACSTRGYRRVTWEGRRQYAHRVVYTLLVGPVPDGMELDHLCRNRACCSPAHLEVVHRSVNVRRGLMPGINTARAEARTRCPKGHPYDDANTYRAPGQRACRECHRRWSREWKARRRNQGAPA